jgi:hypothetical protein
MKNTEILCIDFGSAYTKVAFRSGWDESAELVRDVPIAAKETSFCIPSVVARVERPDGVRWSIGLAAASQTPAEGVKVYRHWKARLLSQRPEEQEGKDSLGDRAVKKQEEKEYQQVGVIFFKKLREALRHLNLPLDLGKCPVRVCIPRLEKDTEGRDRMRDILDQAGWHPAENGPTIYEPESNTCGVFTRGRNATWSPPGCFPPERFAYYPRMFDQDGLFGAFRRAALGRRDGHYGVLVIDIGAFTTDFGYVEFDDSFYDDRRPRPDIVSFSCEIGVRELDKAVYERMRPAVQKAIRRLSTTAWEDIKRLLYDKKPAAVRNPAGGMLVIGEGTEARMIVEAIKVFASGVIQAKNDFCKHHVRGRIDAQVLTGGGSLIPLVRETLVMAMKESSGRVYDLLDEEEPKQALTPQRGPSGWYHDPKEVELRLRQNQELLRGGSAIGGCSVFFE